MDDVIEAPLAGRRVKLRSMAGPDLDFVYALFTAEGVNFRWILRGSTPNPIAVRERLFQGASAVFIVEAVKDGTPIGVVSCYNADLVSGYAYVAIVLRPTHQRLGWPMEAILLMINYSFACWPFRKLYIEGPEFNIEQFGSVAGKYMAEEARFVDRHFYGGRYWDWVVLGLRRETWQEHQPRLLPIRTT